MSIWFILSKLVAFLEENPGIGDVFGKGEVAFSIETGQFHRPMIRKFGMTMSTARETSVK